MIRLYNGDCLEIMDKLIAEGVKVDAIITDPPYGTTACKWDSVIPFDEMWQRLNKLIKDNGAICLFAQTPFDKTLGASNIKMLKYEWIWEKDNGTGFLNAHKMPMKIHENILIFYKKLPTYNPQMRSGFKPYSTSRGDKNNIYGKFDNKYISESKGDRFPIDVIKFNKDSNKIHPTQKPLALMEYLVKTYTNEGDIVLDFTMGSGTTGVACKHLNRNFIGIELDKGYFDIADQRINRELI